MLPQQQPKPSKAILWISLALFCGTLLLWMDMRFSVVQRFMPELENQLPISAAKRFIKSVDTSQMIKTEINGVYGSYSTDGTLIEQLDSYSRNKAFDPTSGVYYELTKQGLYRYNTPNDTGTNLGFPPEAKEHIAIQGITFDTKRNRVIILINYGVFAYHYNEGGKWEKLNHGFPLTSIAYDEYRDMFWGADPMGGSIFGLNSRGEEARRIEFGTHDMEGFKPYPAFSMFFRGMPGTGVIEVLPLRNELAILWYEARGSSMLESVGSLQQIIAYDFQNKFTVTYTSAIQGDKPY